jgi:predicted small lipoprotein YifL
MMGLDRGGRELSSWSELGLARIAVIGALVAALALSGCGRKGGLDAPPGAAVADQNAPPGSPGAAVAPDGTPIAPQSPRRTTPIDWLID